MKRTLDLDHSGPHILHFARSELDDVLGCVESFPDHRAFDRRGEFVRGREGGRAALQTLIRRLGTECVR